MSKRNQAAVAYAEAAQKFLDKQEIPKDGYGYIVKPSSRHISAAITANYLVVFSFETKHKNIDFVISKDYTGDKITVDRTHMGLAIDNIAKVAGMLRRKVKFIPDLSPEERKKAEAKAEALKEKAEEAALMREIRKVARKR